MLKLVKKLTILFFLSILVYPITVFSDEKDIKDQTAPAASLWYEELAAQGDVEAKYNLGMMNETGWSVPVDLKKAVRWYRDAAKQGHSESQLRLGMLYFLGLGGSQSKLKGQSWIRKSAKQGHGFAQSVNELLFTDEVPDTLDVAKVLKDARKLYLKDDTKAVAGLKRLIGSEKQKAELKELQKEKTTIRERRDTRTIADSSKSDIPTSTTQAGVKKTDRIDSVIPEFVGGETLKENRTLSKGNIETIRFQAKKGQASAQYNLGRMYELGIKVPVNKKEALAWYEKSAIQGYPDAEYRMAIALLYGINTNRDESLGKQWLTAAASHGHQVAIKLLDNITSKEDVVGISKSIALDWYMEKAIVGDAEAALSLGKIFEFGWGVFPDIKEAGKWYQRAAALGATKANELLEKIQASATQNGGESTGSGQGMMVESASSTNWIAYLIAFIVAAVIFFSPSILNRRKSVLDQQEKEFKMLEDMEKRREPSFD